MGALIVLAALGVLGFAVLVLFCFKLGEAIEEEEVRIVELGVQRALDKRERQLVDQNKGGQSNAV
jgi:hypothetical protein